MKYETRSNKPNVWTAEQNGLLALKSAVRLTVGSAKIAAHIGVCFIRDARLDRSARLRNMATIGAKGLHQLGPTFVKFGQMIGTRRDLLPKEVCEALSSLHDAVPAMSDAERRKAWKSALEEGVSDIADVYLTGRILGAGSIACVYEGIAPNGSPVAVKLRRPDVAERMSAELSLIYSLARFLEIFPSFRIAQVSKLIEYMSRAVYGQVRFRREADNSERLRLALANRQEVVIPAVWRQYSNDAVITYELIAGLGEWEGDTRHAEALLEASWDMIFGEGFVHCDLHRGNVYPIDCGRIALLDAGYSVELPWHVQVTLEEFFLSLYRGEGRKCGWIMLQSSEKPIDRHLKDGFVNDLENHVRRQFHESSGFDMMRFGNGVAVFQRKYGVQPSPEFAFPLMSLMVLEGTARDFDDGSNLLSFGL